METSSTDQRNWLSFEDLKKESLLEDQTETKRTNEVGQI